MKRQEPARRSRAILFLGMARLRLAAIGIGLALAGCAHPPPAPQVRAAPPAKGESRPKPDFSGHWVLNVEASDEPLEKAKAAMQSRKQAQGGGRGMGGGGMGGGGMRRGGGMGGGQAGRGGGDGGLPAGELAGLLAPARALHITHDDPMLLIADENDQRQHLYTDFRGASVSASGGLRQRVAAAGWEGAMLVVETTMIGNKLTQNYQIDTGTEQLVIASTARISAGTPISFRLVYDRQKPEGMAAEPSRQFAGTAQKATP